MRGKFGRRYREKEAEGRDTGKETQGKETQEKGCRERN
jgi:hypothetical protein